MNKEKKLIFLVIIIIAVILCVVFFAKGKSETPPQTEVLEDGTVVSTSGKLKEKKKYDVFEISNIKVEAGDNLTTISGEFKNVSKKDAQSQYIGIKVYNEKGDVIATLDAIIAPPGDLKGTIKPDEVVAFNAAITEKLDGVYDVEFLEPSQTEIVAPEENENQ